jgi:hypothetical protein
MPLERLPRIPCRTDAVGQHRAARASGRPNGCLSPLGGVVHLAPGDDPADFDSCVNEIHLRDPPRVGASSRSIAASTAAVPMPSRDACRTPLAVDEVFSWVIPLTIHKPGSPVPG